MEENKKLFIIVGVFLVVAIFSIRNKGTVQLVEEKVNKEDYKAVALHISEDGTNYNETDNIPTSGYSINMGKSVCRVYDGTGLMEEAPIDNNTIIEYIDHKINIKGISKRSTRCYLYFDKLTDTTKPIISNVTTSVTKTEITVNVTASDIGIEDSVGTVTEYWYQINNNTAIKSTSNSYKFTGLSASTTYTIKVYVKDLAGNQSETTTKSATTTAPTSEDTLAKLNITDYSASVSDFNESATADEGIYRRSDGMYGGYTYFWRGATETNYLKFAGFCWRIIRINGDGSIRLIYDGTTCHANGTSTADSIVVTSQAYSTLNDRSEYVGWTYTLGSQRTLSGTASNAKTQLESWYSSNITGTNAEKVADGKYCNDRNVQSGSTWKSLPSNNSEAFFYAAYSRTGMGLNATASPTFNCPTNDVYRLKIGTITMDEVIFAGSGKYNKSNSSYYLYNGQNYWTMTPNGWYSYNKNEQSVGMYFVDTNGSFSAIQIHTSKGLRPVINLRSDITFSSGNGTQNSPYTVSNT